MRILKIITMVVPILIFCLIAYLAQASEDKDIPKVHELKKGTWILELNGDTFVLENKKLRAPSKEEIKEFEQVKEQWEIIPWSKELIPWTLEREGDILMFGTLRSEEFLKYVEKVKRLNKEYEEEIGIIKKLEENTKKLHTFGTFKLEEFTKYMRRIKELFKEVKKLEKDMKKYYEGIPKVHELKEGRWILEVNGDAFVLENKKLRAPSKEEIKEFEQVKQQYKMCSPYLEKILEEAIQ